jgi:hypothetical protein
MLGNDGDAALLGVFWDERAITNNSYYEDAVDDYLPQSSKLQRQFNWDFGNVVVFGLGDCGQLGCKEGVMESRAPRILWSNICWKF